MTRPKFRPAFFFSVPPPPSPPAPTENLLRRPACTDTRNVERVGRSEFLNVELFHFANALV